MTHPGVMLAGECRAWRVKCTSVQLHARPRKVRGKRTSTCLFFHKGQIGCIMLACGWCTRGQAVRPQRFSRGPCWRLHPGEKCRVQVSFSLVGAKCNGTDRGTYVTGSGKA